jgi:hypothetical protein
MRGEYFVDERLVPYSTTPRLSPRLFQHRRINTNRNLLSWLVARRRSTKS